MVERLQRNLSQKTIAFNKYLFGKSDWFSVHQIVCFSLANRHRNRFAQPTSLQIKIGMVRKLQNFQRGIGIVFVRQEVFANYSQIPDIFFSPSLFCVLYAPSIKGMHICQNQSVYIFSVNVYILYQKKYNYEYNEKQLQIRKYSSN